MDADGAVAVTYTDGTKSSVVVYEAKVVRVLLEAVAEMAT